MKKTKIILKTVFLFLFAVFLLQGCREESTLLSNNQNTVKIHQSENVATFREVLNAVSLKDEKSVMAKANNFNDNYIATDYIMDTTKIKRTSRDGMVTEYAIFLKKKNEKDDHVFYNLVFTKKTDHWKKHLIKFNPVYDNSYKVKTFIPEIISNSKNKTSRSQCTSQFIIYEKFNCPAGHINPDDGDCGGCWDLITFGFVNSCEEEAPGDFNVGGGESGGGSGTSQTTDPCEKAKSSISKANTMLNHSQVHSNVDVVLKGKTQSPLEYAKKIGKNTDGTYSFSQLIEGEKNKTDITNVALPSGSNYVADGHSHAGGNGDPSAGDFYGMLEQLVNNSYFETRFVYGDYFGTPEVYALVLNDRAQALEFLANYPKANNYDTRSHSFLRNSILGDAFWEANELHGAGTSVNSSGENYVSPAIGMAYILEKYNVGISLAKADANGNLKKINASIEEIEVPHSGGARKRGVKITKCP